MKQQLSIMLKLTRKKDGHSCTNICATHSISLEDVVKSVEQACEKAKETVTELGMSYVFVEKASKLGQATSMFFTK